MVRHVPNVRAQYIQRVVLLHLVPRAQQQHLIGHVEREMGGPHSVHVIKQFRRQLQMQIVRVVHCVRMPRRQQHGEQLLYLRH